MACVAFKLPFHRVCGFQARFHGGHYPSFKCHSVLLLSCCHSIMHFQVVFRASSSQFAWHVSSSGCFHRVCGLPVGRFWRVSLSLQFVGVFHILLSIQFYSVCGLQVVFMTCVAFKLFSWRLRLSSERISSITRFQTCFFNVYCPHFLIVCCMCHCSVSSAFIGFFSQSSFRSVCHFQSSFFCIFCSYINFIQFVMPPFLGPFFRGLLLLQSCVRHVILVLYLTYTFDLYFAFCVFSVSMLFRISCSLLLFNPYQLLVIFSFLQLVMVQKIFLSIFCFVHLCSRNRTYQFSFQFI